MGDLYHSVVKRVEECSEHRSADGPWADAQDRLPLTVSLFLLGAPLWLLIALLVSVLIGIFH
jgi:hypothetical protein